MKEKKVKVGRPKSGKKRKPHTFMILIDKVEEAIEKMGSRAIFNEWLEIQVYDYLDS